MRRGEICIVDLIAGAGHEQYGQRPAILISDTNANIVIVIPLTANLEALRFSHTLTIFPDAQNNLQEKSVALIFHLRAIDKSRIIRTIGKLNKNIQKQIDKTLMEMLDL